LYQLINQFTHKTNSDEKNAEKIDELLSMLFYLQMGTSTGYASEFSGSRDTEYTSILTSGS